MRRRTALLLIMALALCGAGARAELMLDGSVVCAGSASQAASMGGPVSAVYVKPGDFVRAGDPVAALAPTRVFAPCDGTVEAVFAREGESADAAVRRYGGAIALLPENRYTVYATAEGAYRSVRTGRVVPGQTVWLKCTRDGSHRGTGVVYETDGDVIWIEATGGEFYNGETVGVYMASGCSNRDRVAKGTATAALVENVSASGDVYKLWVEPGDFVEKGQLLMETLAALPEAEELDVISLTPETDGERCVLTAEADGYVTAVAAAVGADIDRGALLMSYCPADALAVVVRVPEDDVAAVTVGSEAALAFELSEETLRLVGEVRAVSYLPARTGSGVAYDVYIAFPADARIVPGMSATATLGRQPGEAPQ